MPYPPDPLPEITLDTELDDYPPLHNAVAAAIDDTVAELGAGPKGAAADLTARLAALDTTVADEATTRAAADTALDGRLDAVETDLPTKAEQADLDAEEAARAAADALLIPLTQKAAANGVATLGADGKLPSAQIPPLAIGETSTVASEAAMLALTAQRGDIAVRTDLDPDGVFILTTDDPTLLANWVQITAPGAVLTVDGRAGTVSLSDLYQPLADDLTAIAALATTAYGRAFLALVDAAAARTALALGTAATADKVAAGAAGVLDATDPTTTDARTPTAHAAAHADGGTDEVTLTQEQVSGLVAALDGKLTQGQADLLYAALAHAHDYVPLATVDAAGDLLVGSAADTVARLAKGAALDVLRVNAGATALEWAAPAGGGGGVSWDQEFDESGASIANWTVVGGTWASDGAKIGQSVPGINGYRSLRYTSAMRSAGYIVEAEVRFPSTNQPASGNIILGFAAAWDGTDAGVPVAVGCRLWRAVGSAAGFVDVHSQNSIVSEALTVNFDQWYKLRCLVQGVTCVVWVDEVATVAALVDPALRAAKHVGIFTHWGTADFRNLKAWTLGGLPA